MKKINMNKNLAVLMSVYKNDQLHFLKLAIESILNQTYFKFDLFIKSDGVLKKECKNYLLSLEDPRIVFKQRKENRGLAISLNEIIIDDILPKEYEYIARMDADDISELNRFEKQIDFLEINQEIDCLGTWAIEIRENGEEYFKKKMPLNHEDCYKLFQIRDCLIHPSVMFRNTYFKKSGLYPEDTFFGEDTIMWAQGFKNGAKFANLPEFLIKFRIDNNFFKRRRGINHAKSILSLRKRVIKMLNFGLKSKFYAYMYALVKITPTKILNVLYKYSR
jgi:glycosyltransferase involved in cell wall biosynthesis